MKKKLCVVMTGLCFLSVLGAVTRAEMVARYTFDDGTAADSSAYANNGVINGGVTAAVDPQRGQVLNFDGANGSYIRVTNSDSLNTIAGQITIAMWLNTPNTGTRQLIEKGGTGSRAWDIAPWGIRMESDRRLQIHWGNVSVLYSSAVPLNTWTHVAMTFDSTLAENQIKFYMNGSLDTQVTWTGASTVNTNDLFIATDWYNATSRWAWIGLMDELQIYNTALSEGEIGVTMTGGGVTNIDPSNGAKFVPINKVLSWDPPAETEPNFVITGYDVYFDANDVKVKAGDSTVKAASNQSATAYDPFGASDMANSTKYFWRVDVVGQYDYATEPNTFEGAVFSFTTESLEPTITGQPLNQVRGPANEKTDAALSVTAVNATNYQWYKDGLALSGATDSTLTIAPVQLSDEGLYYCAVSNTDSPTIVNSNTVQVEYARLTSQWAFENDYVDSVGGHNGMVADANSTPGFAAGYTAGSNALILDGAEDYLILPAAALSKAGTEMTFAFWARNNTPTAGTVTLYGYAETLPGNRLINVHTPWSSNTAYLDVSNAEAAGLYDRVGAGSAVVTTGEPYWIHWVFTKDQESGIMRVYRNGVQIGQATSQARRYYGADHLQLGANRDGTGLLGQFFNGSIDDLRVYNYAVDAVEAAYLYYDATNTSVCINDADPVVAKYDFNDNCKIDLPDLAEIAVHWLHCQQVPACVARP